MVHRVCAICGAEFRGHHRQRICSIDCYKAYRARGTTKRPTAKRSTTKRKTNLRVCVVCVFCGVEFEGRSRQRVCSDVCHMAYRAKKARRLRADPAVWEAQKARQRARYAADPAVREAVRACSRAYYRANRETVLARAAERNAEGRAVLQMLREKGYLPPKWIRRSRSATLAAAAHAYRQLMAGKIPTV